MNPFSHQPKIINDARNLMLQGARDILIELATGGGKTYLMSEMFKGCLQRQKTADFYVHRKELITQTAKTFRKQGIPFGIIAAGEHCGQSELIQLCSVQTTCRMPPRKTFMLACDEAQHIMAKSYNGLDANFFFGLSATPITPSGGGLGAKFTHMINGPTIPELQAQGCLSQYQYFAPSIPDLSAVGIIAGDYNQTDIDRIMQGKTIVGDIIRHWHRLAAGKLTIGFAPSVAASRAYVEAFQTSGVTAGHIDANTPKNERRAICEAFCRRDITVLFNCGILEEGFDIGSYGDTDVTVEALINAKPTKSLRLARQINGRVLRRKPYPAIILDHAGQFTRTGMPDDIIEWSLNAPAKNITRSVSTVPIQMCQSCDLCFSPAAECPYCGHVAVPKERVLRHTEGQLQEIKRSEAAARKVAEERLKKQKLQDRREAKTYPQLVAFAEKYGYENPTAWAAHFQRMRSEFKRGKRS